MVDLLGCCGLAVLPVSGLGCGGGGKTKPAGTTLDLALAGTTAEVFDMMTPIFLISIAGHADAAALITCSSSSVRVACPPASESCRRCSRRGSAPLSALEMMTWHRQRVKPLAHR